MRIQPRVVSGTGRALWPLRSGSSEPEVDPTQARSVIGMRVDAVSYASAARQIATWARRGESRYVCVASVNNAVQASADAEFRRVMNEADLVTPDGMPLVWALRILGLPEATRVYGPDLTPLVCELARDHDIPVGFYGGTPASVEALVTSLSTRVPRLRVVYRWAPPFRPLTPEEDERACDDIRRSGARILFVGLGAPKQECWMAEHRGRIGAVMVGVGAAFDYLAGRKRQAPRWMQENGLEWVYRLAHEPRRLWRRYLVGNPRFVMRFAAQFLVDPNVPRNHLNGKVKMSGNGKDPR
jgi:N-acetylglucosaminyldiphosphoundecaprenol N-acetyl-beta-D-mannosaminyltransferase